MDPHKPLKVVMLASSYPRSAEDSAAIFLRYLAESLSQRGIEVHVLAPSDKKGGRRLENKVAVHRFQYFPAAWQQLAYGSGILPNLRRNPWLWVQVPFFLISMTSSLLRLLWKERPDIIHGHWVLPQGLVAVLTKPFFKIPIISTAHGSDAFALRSSLMRRLKQFAVAKSDAWTANTRATSDALELHSSLPKPHIIPIGVDVDHFCSGNRVGLRQELPENELLALFVGRLVENKGAYDLLQAFSLLPLDLHARTSLWVVGDGEERSKLQEYAQTAGISHKIRFWGSIDNHRLPDFYAAADLFVAPSFAAATGSSEGQGVVFLEAFAARLCVLATRVGGISEVVEDGHTGVLVEPHDPQQLSAAMSNLLGNERLRLEFAQNAFSKVKKHYDWKKIAQDFGDLYLSVLKSRQGEDT